MFRAGTTVGKVTVLYTLTIYEFYVNDFLFLIITCRGILWAPISGLAMAELIVSGTCTTLDLRAFYPGRFEATGKKSSRGRKMVDTDVGEQW